MMGRSGEEWLGGPPDFGYEMTECRIIIKFKQNISATYTETGSGLPLLVRHHLVGCAQRDQKLTVLRLRIQIHGHAQRTIAAQWLTCRTDLGCLLCNDNSCTCLIHERACPSYLSCETLPE